MILTKNKPKETEWIWTLGANTQQELPCFVQYKPIKGMRFSLKFNNNKPELHISASPLLSATKIKTILAEKQDLITGWLAKYRIADTPSDTIWLHGKAYPFEFQQGLKTQLHFKDDRIKISVPNIKTHRPQETLASALINYAEAYFQTRFAVYKDKALSLGLVHSGNFTLKITKGSWGMCRSDGTIFINPKLIHYADHCIDYVICHELCHLKEMNHSPAFYKLLAKIMPLHSIYKADLQKTKLNSVF